MENASFIKLNNKFQKIFDEIKEKLDYNEERIEKFIQDFVKYYNIKDLKFIDQLALFLKSKKEAEQLAARDALEKSEIVVK